MQISKSKMTIKNSKLLRFLLFVVLVVLVIFVVVQKQNEPSKSVEQPTVRDEFIDKLVAETTQVYPLVVTGRKYYEQGELERAQKLFKKTTELDRMYRDGFYHLGITELALGNADRAYYALLRAKTIDPIYKPTLEALIKVYELRGDVVKAQDVRNKADKL